MNITSPERGAGERRSRGEEENTPPLQMV